MKRAINVAQACTVGSLGLPFTSLPETLPSRPVLVADQVFPPQGEGAA